MKERVDVPEGFFCDTRLAALWREDLEKYMASLPPQQRAGWEELLVLLKDRRLTCGGEGVEKTEG